MNAASPSRLAGKLLVTGFDGPILTTSTADALARGERAGCILFKRNMPSAAATRALNDSIRRASGRTPLIAVDEEGGRVSRLPPGEPRLPPMRVLGAIGDPELAQLAGRAVGARLSELGFNLDFAPVLDVDSNPANPVIGDRSFGASPKLVAQLGLAFADGLNAARVLACGKHFPGHGDTDKDSHFDLPVVRHSRDRLDRVELAPFREAARRGLDAIMSAHVVIEAIEPNVPATFSHRAMTELLRGELGFQGALFSDDLEMRAVSALRSAEESAVLSIMAGCDILLVCKEEEIADRVHAALVREIEKSPAFAERAADAARRSDALVHKASVLEASRHDGAPSLHDVLSEIEEAIGRSTVVP